MIESLIILIIIVALLLYVKIWYTERILLDVLHNHAEAIRALRDKEPDQTLKLPAVTQRTTAKKTSTIIDTDGMPIRGHTLIVGLSGSGKSNALMGHLIRKINDGQQLYIIDTKKELCPIFGRYAELCTDPEHADATLSMLLDTANDRQEMFAELSQRCKRPVRDRDEYERISGEEMPLICLVMEELNVLHTMIDMKKLLMLLQVGRSAGVFVVCLSQYLQAKILDRAGSVNFTTRVYLGQWDDISIKMLFGSRIDREKVNSIKSYLGQPGKAIIEKPGENGVEMFKVQIPRVDESMLQLLMEGGE